MWFATTGSGSLSPSSAHLLMLSDSNFGVSTGGFRILLAIDTSGRMSAFIQTGLTVIGPTSPATIVDDGELHHAVLTLTLDNATDTVSGTLILDGVATAPSAPVAWPNVSAAGIPFPRDGEPALGGAAYGRAVQRHACARGRVRPGHHRHRGRSLRGASQRRSHGFTSDASGARISRYARLAGIPTAEVSVETGLSTSIAHKDTTGQTAAQMMQDVAETEDGIVFDGKDGTLTFHARSHRYASTSAFTLSVTAGEVEADLSPVLDDQGMANDVTASRANGVTIRSVNQASIDEYGYYRDSIEILTTSDNEVQARADWQVNRFGTPRVKLTSVTVDVINCTSAQKTLLLAADLGTRFTVSNLPSQAPAATMDFFIEGITYDIGPESFTVTFNTSAAAYANVWIWDSATQSQWGPDHYLRLLIGADDGMERARHCGCRNHRDGGVV